MVYDVLVIPRKRMFGIAICCKSFHLGVTIGIGKTYIFMILNLSLYVLGWSFSMLCVGKCVGSLKMYGGGLGCSNGGGGGDRRGVLVVLCVYYDLVFCIHFSECLVSCC